MEKTFKHPLARKATATKLRPRDGVEQTILLIVTTLELHDGAQGFNAKNVARLNEAALDFIGEAPEFSGYALVNRPKDWDA